MDTDNFTLKFEYKGHPHILEVQTWHQAYKTVYKVTIGEHDITFEPDEEGFVRAIAMNPLHNASVAPDPALLHHVAELIITHIS